MKSGLIILSLYLGSVFIAPAEIPAGQERGIDGAVTYVSGTVYYISLGTKEGMEDSLLVTVGSRGDTIALLKIFAVSSKSSACRLVSGKRAPVVGDRVSVVVESRPSATEKDAGRDSAGNPAERGAVQPSPVAGTASGESSGGRTVTTTGKPSPGPPSFRVGGRISARYQSYLFDGAPGSVTQPSLSISLRGEARDLPIRVEFSGSLRSTLTGTSAPFGSAAVNRSRVHRLYVAYEDIDMRLGLGRLLPSTNLPSGYIDGLVFARRIGLLECGAAAGYEPDYAQRSFSTDRRKVMVFAGAGNRGGSPWSLNVGFSKTFLGPSPERSVVSASGYLSPSPAFSLTARTEVDLLNIKNSEVVTRPKLSSLQASMSYRISPAVTVGAGVTAWRPVYPLSTVSGMADSLVDSRLWVSPTATLRFYTRGGVSLQESYSPRTTQEGFGREYFNMLSVGFNDAFGSGVSVRGSQTLNRTSFVSTTGYGVNLRRTVWMNVDADARYTWYRYTFDGADNGSTSSTIGADMSFPAGPAFFVMISGEYSRSGSSDTRLFSGSVSWRF